MKITIGGRDHIASASLLVPENEDAWIEFEAGTWSNIKINITFIKDAENTETRYELNAQENNDYLALKIINWNNWMPAATPIPCIFGEDNGRNISFLITGYSVNGFNKFDISFFWEKVND